jgi:hypothetical protein
VQPGELPQPTGEWECVECGHIEPGFEALRPKQCPECGAPAKGLEFFPWEDDRSAWDAEGAEDTEDEEDPDEDEEDEY